MSVKQIDILKKMLDYEGYIATNQLRNDLGVPNSRNSEEYISFRENAKNFVKDGLLEYDDVTKRTQEAYKPEYRDSVIDNQFGNWKIRLTSNGRREVREESAAKNINKNENRSNIKIERARDVHIDQRQTINQGNTAVEYQGEKKDTAFIEFLCKAILERFGLKKTLLSGAVSVIIGFASFLLSINSLPILNFRPYFSYLPTLPTLFAPLLVVGLAMISLGGLILDLPEHKRSTKCSNCGTFYALRENKNPTEKQIKVKDGTMVNRTRYLKCSKCGHEETRDYSYLIEDEDEN